jgi:uncharacterized repeat protein (TIGR01451 family)
VGADKDQWYKAAVRRVVTAPRSAVLVMGVALALFGVAPAAGAATTLSAEIVSWQVVGLKHNDAVGGAPELFLVQVEVRNTGSEPATNVRATLALGAPSSPCNGGACISLVSNPTYNIGSIPPGGEEDAFWTVRVTRTDQAFGTDTPVTVDVVADNAPGVTASQAPRTGLCAPDTPGGILHVEGLISQNRNEILSYVVSPGVQVSPSVWEVPVGSTFTVTVQAATATTFDEISVPAVVEPAGFITPDAVSFTFEQGTSTDDDIYTRDAGGRVTAVYGYRAATVGQVTVSQLIYDCSGGSFHYNTDYKTNFVTIRVVQPPPPPAMTLQKSASAASAAPGERVTFTINYNNAGGPATGVVITDDVDRGLTDVAPSAGGTFDAAARQIRWQVGNVAAGAVGSVSFSATVTDAAAGLTLRNIAVADTAETEPVSSPATVLAVRQIIPATGRHSAVLAVVAFALIGAGICLSSRRLELIDLANLR